MRSLFALCRWIGILVSIVAGFWFVNYVVKLIVTPGTKNPELLIGNSSHAEPFQSHPEDWLKIEVVQPNCGLYDQCPDNHVAVSLSTFMTTMLYICVAGKVVMQKNVNGGGRGLNIVVIDDVTLQPIKARNFDTYDRDSSALEVFLQRNNESRKLFVMLTHDEASKSMSSEAKRLITQLGSGKIQNLGFRDQWYMVGQGGINGFTPYEKLLDSQKATFTNLTETLCVPKVIKGRIIQPDPSLANNNDRAILCRQHPELTYFCAGSVMYDPVPVCSNAGSRALVGSPLLSSAVLVLGSSADMPGLALTLETLAMQPGLKPWMVTVVYDPELLPHAPQLIKLFSFVAFPAAGVKWPDTLEAGLREVVSSHGSSEYVMIIEEGLILSPDYFSVMGALLPLLSDPTTLAISGWNPNGYSGINSRLEVVHRVSDTPGLAFVVTWQTVTHHLLRDVHSCCSKRGWEGWSDWRAAGGWVAVPEVSRVLMRPTAPHLDHQESINTRQLFGRLRRTSLTNTELVGVEELRGGRYLELLTEIVSGATVLPYTSHWVKQCARDESTPQLPLPHNTSDSGAVVVPYRERSDDAGSLWDGLVLLCRCFGLYDPGDGGVPMGLYRGTLRLSFESREVLFISHRSPLFSVKFASSAMTLP